MERPKVKFISKEGLFEMMENKERFKLVEVLPEDSYQEGHLPFAINIPVTEIEEKSKDLLPDKNETIVVYCADFLCLASTDAARKLQRLGYTNVLDFKGGKGDWQAAGLPLIKSR